MTKALPYLVCILILWSYPAQQEASDVNRHRHIQEKARLHGVHSELLRNTMQRMNLLIIDDMYRPLQLSGEDQEYLDALIQAAADLTFSAEILTQYIPVPELSEQQRSTFRNLAEQIYTEARNVEVNAEKENLLEMDAAFQRMEKTCVKCHSLFRER